MGENYPHESLKLFSQSVRGCAIIHVGFLSLVFVTPHYTGFIEGKPLRFLKTHISRQARNRAGFCPAWRMATGGVPCEFRGFQRNLAKPSNQDETAKRRITASSRAIWRLSHGVSRPSMKNGESPASNVIGHCNAGIYFCRVERVDRVEAFCHNVHSSQSSRGPSRAWGKLTQRHRDTEGDL